MRTIAIYVLYGIGHALYWSMDRPIADRFLVPIFFRPYQWCMLKSSDLDIKQVFWKQRQEATREQE